VLGKLPSGWQIVELGAVLENGARNGIYKPPQFHGTGAKMVNMGELFAHPRLKSVPMQRVELTQDEEERFGLRVGDLLFARRSLVAEGAGKCSVVLEVGGPTAFESSLIRARPNPTVADSLFLYYLFTSKFGSYALGTILRQVAVSGITGSDLVRLKIPLPPLLEQKVIVRVLSALDDKIELNRRMNETLEAMARAIFKSWFVDFDPVRAKLALSKAEGAAGRQPFGMDAETAVLFPDSFRDSPLGKIPKGWKTVPLPEIVEVNPSRSLSKGQKATYLDMQNMPTLGHRPTDWIVRPFVSGSRFMNGDTLLARITPCLENGKTALVDFLKDSEVGWGSTEFIVLHPKEPFPPEYGYCLARDEDFRSHAIQNMTGSSGRQRVPTDSLAQYWVVAPPEPIALCFGKAIRPLFAKVKTNSEESATLAAIRDALLPKLLSGEIRVGKIGKLAEADAK
jgi:type I restriction enzyme S subunit